MDKIKEKLNSFLNKRKSSSTEKEPPPPSQQDKSEDKINQCLDSISQEFKVIVVENSKNTNFKNQIEQNYSNVECILAGDNLGYAKGNNLGLSNVETKYALILNPDAKLEKNTLENFLISANIKKIFA